MESYWTWTKIRSSYLVNKGIRYGVVLEKNLRLIYLITVTKRCTKENVELELKVISSSRLVLNDTRWNRIVPGLKFVRLI